MTKLNHSISTDLRAIVLYEEDIREVYALLKENCQEVNLKVDNLAFDDINELIAHFAPHKIKQLEISTKNPHIRIDLVRYSCSLYGESDAPAVEGLCHKCAKILTKRTKLYGVLSSYPFLWAFILIQVPVYYYATKDWKLVINLIYVPYCCWALFVQMARNPLIYARKADNLESLVFRNKDQLFLEAFKGIVSIIIGIFLQRYLHLLK